MLIRLKEELERTGGLAKKQFGFMDERSIVNAILAESRKANKAADYSHAQRIICAVITLDMRNAFNSVSWQRILNELSRRGVKDSFIKLIGSYLSERSIMLEAENLTSS